MASQKFFMLSNLSIYLSLPMLKISFFFKLEWLKILKDILEEDYPIVAPEIS